MFGGSFEDATDADDWRPACLVAARMSDRNDPFTLLEAAGVSFFGMRELGDGVGDLDESAIDAGVPAEGDTLELAAIRQNNVRGPAWLARNVPGRQDITFAID